MGKIGIHTSPARRQFKKLLGQVNHYLITILVGLNAVEKGEAVLGGTFSTNWNPRSPQASARQSREFALKATLAWTVDALDAYASQLHQSPRLLESDTLYNAMSAAGRSVDAKTDALIEGLDIKDNISSSLTKLAITWRNRLVHHQADNPLSDEVRQSLLSQSKKIADNYRGLEIESMLISFDKSLAPRFKEAASLAQASHDFVSNCDSLLLVNLDLPRFVTATLRHHLTKNYKSKPENDPKSRAGRIWNRTQDDSIRTLIQILQNYGISSDGDGFKVAVDDSYLIELSGITPAEAITRFVVSGTAKSA